MLPKPGKDNYNECGSYRTVSVTSCISKHYEYISSQRLIVVIKEKKFDCDQFAYLENRNAIQAIY